MRRFLRDNGLTLFFLLAFLLALVGQAVTGWHEFNDIQIVEGADPVSLPAYVTSSDFAVDVTENWQSEYLQFLLFIMATVWLVQRGSPESKKVEERGDAPDERQRVGRHADEDSPRWAAAYGWRRALYSNSLGLVMATIFLLSWLAQSVSGLSARNAERLAQLQDPVTWGSYVTSAEFWARTFQNWQSEMLAVASMVVLAIYLRQRSSPESKPVGAAHRETNVEG